MLAPISWLKDYVDINVSPETLAKKLVAIGFEVEEIIRQSEQAKKVVTAKLVSVEKHPSADRLRVAQADIGGRVIQVVTNVAVNGGEYVAVAPSGAVLAGGQVIKSGELRGVRSEGMLCGLEEVGVECDAVDGQTKGDILRFPEGTPLGINALKALGWDDVVLDVAVTANRPDCNSIYRLAKEVAVALGKDCREPHIAYGAPGSPVNEMVSVEVRDSDLCPRYMAGGVREVKIAYRKHFHAPILTQNQMFATSWDKMSAARRVKAPWAAVKRFGGIGCPRPSPRRENAAKRLTRAQTHNACACASGESLVAYEKKRGRKLGNLSFYFGTAWQASGGWMAEEGERRGGDGRGSEGRSGRIR